MSSSSLETKASRPSFFHRRTRAFAGADRRFEHGFGLRRHRCGWIVQHIADAEVAQGTVTGGRERPLKRLRVRRLGPGQHPQSGLEIIGATRHWSGDRQQRREAGRFVSTARRVTRPG